LCGDGAGVTAQRFCSAPLVNTIAVRAQLRKIFLAARLLRFLKSAQPLNIEKVDSAQKSKDCRDTKTKAHKTIFARFQFCVLFGCGSSTLSRLARRVPVGGENWLIEQRLDKKNARVEL
jgi:hypothetical protein